LACLTSVLTEHIVFHDILHDSGNANLFEFHRCSRGDVPSLAPPPPPPPLLLLLLLLLDMVWKIPADYVCRMQDARRLWGIAVIFGSGH
jgi:hypothetical protein